MFSIDRDVCLYVCRVSFCLQKSSRVAADTSRHGSGARSARSVCSDEGAAHGGAASSTPEGEAGGGDVRRARADGAVAACRCQAG